MSEDVKPGSVLSPGAAETVPAAAPTVDPDRLEQIARNHILAALGVGLVPLPLVDVAGIFAVNLDLIRVLAKEYGVSFRAEWGKSALGALLGGVLPTALGGAVISLLKFVPVIGQTAGAVAFPVLAGAVTYAVYKVFVLHFASGGTFLTFDPAKVQDYFRAQVEAGKGVAQSLRDQGKTKTV